MVLPMTDEFRDICRRIRDEVQAGGREALVDSDDLYQTPNFCGGWSSETPAFWFSFYAPDGGDYIFSFTLEEALTVAVGGCIAPELEYWKQAPDW